MTNLALADIRDSLNAGLIGPLVDGGIPYAALEMTVGSAVRGDLSITDLRTRFSKHLRSAGEFPGYCDVGLVYFKGVYDWHVRHRQPIQMTRTAQNQMVIQFMFTQLVLRPEMDELYCGTPYDK